MWEPIRPYSKYVYPTSYYNIFKREKIKKDSWFWKCLHSIMYPALHPYTYSISINYHHHLEQLFLLKKCLYSSNSTEVKAFLPGIQETRKHNMHEKSTTQQLAQPPLSLLLLLLTRLFSKQNGSMQNPKNMYKFYQHTVQK